MSERTFGWSSNRETRERPIWTGFLWDTPVAPPPAPDDVILTTRGGHQLMLGDSGNEVTVSHSGGSTVRLDATGRIELSASSTVQLTASKVEVQAAVIELEAGGVDASGLLKCNTLLGHQRQRVLLSPRPGEPRVSGATWRDGREPGAVRAGPPSPRLGAPPWKRPAAFVLGCQARASDLK